MQEFGSVVGISIGQPLHCDVYDRSNGLLLMKKGSVVSTQSQIDVLVRRGDLIRAQNAPLSTSEIVSSENTNFLAQHSFQCLDQVRAKLDLIYADRERLPSMPLIISSLASKIIYVCRVSPDAALSTILRPSTQRYSVKHHMDTAIVSAVALKSLGYSAEESLPVVAGALTMNIGMHRLQDLLASYDGSIGWVVRKKVESHVVDAVDILRSGGVKDFAWLRVVQQHHERLDGKGYPLGLSGSQICEPARVVRIADIYCAKVCGRADRRVLPPNQALQRIAQDENDHSIDKDLARLLIAQMGVYPPGCFVRLANGDIALVTKRGAVPDKPIVWSLIKPSGFHYSSPICRTTTDARYAIKGVIWMPPQKAGINRDSLWDREWE